MRQFGTLPEGRNALLLSLFSFAVILVLQGCSSTASINSDPPPKDTIAPTAPSAVTATATSSTQVGVTWTASSDNVGVSGYLVERCTGASCTGFSQVGTTPNTSYSDSGLAGGTTYGYRVRATDAAGNMSGYSNTSYVTTSASTDHTPPSAPSGLTATAVSSSQINLSWTASTDNVGVTGYRIERCSGSGCSSFAQIATTGGSTMTYNNTGLTASTSYSYQVRANDAAGNLSGYSNTASAATTATTDGTPPSAPSGLTAAAASSSQINLSWTASTDNVGVTGYRIERCNGSGCSSFAQIATTGGSTVSYSNTGLTASTSYSYRVRATDAAGNLGGYSNTASATTKAATDSTPPSAPSGLTATAASSSQINLSWTASTDNVGVTGYRIERCSGSGCSSFAQIATTGGSTMTYNNTGLTASTSYSYQVRANDAAGNLSGYSNTASATTSGSGGGGPITVSLTPRRGGLVTGQTLPIKVTLTNDTTNAGVTWSSSGGGSFSPATAITSGNSVTYTAPSSAGAVTLTATSVADTSKTATVTLGITDLSAVATYHNNNSRDGTNQKEYALTTSDVNSTTFGKLFSCYLDGTVYAQPLWVPKVSIGGGTHNIVLAVSMRDSVYAFDADANPCVTYWSKTLIPSGETWGSYGDVGSSDIYPDIGILGTPVIDVSAKVVYLVTKTKTTGGTYHQRLHALNLGDGSERTNSPVEIDSSISVSGNCEGGSTVTFNALRENQRAGLALANGTVYVTWASHGDVDPYHGWVIGYSTSDLSRVSVFNASPNQAGGQSYCRSGIWMSGGAPAIDSSNSLYMITGNGTFDADTGGKNFGDSLIKLSSGLSLSDWFTPNNQSFLDSSDLDLGAGGAVVLVDLPSGAAHPHLLIGGGKGSTFNGEIFLLNRDSLGHIVSNDSQVLQKFPVGGGIFATEAYWQNTMYIAGVNQPLKAYSFDTTTEQFNTSTVPQSSNSFGFPGATPSVSSAGSSNGIVWAINAHPYGTNNGGSSAAGAAVLHAYSASNVAMELWNSTQGSGNTAGNSVKFTVPTIANGKVYVPTRGDDTTQNSPTHRGEITVYGLLP